VPFVDPTQLPVKEPRPGWKGRFFHSDHMTFAYYEIAPGSDVHPHRHPQEEVWHVIEGELEMVVDGAACALRPGEAMVVPAEVEHAARTGAGCRAIVVDYPIRESVGGVPTR